MDYREKLSASDYALFDQLRDLRSALASDQKIPPYTIFTNAQLASMVEDKVRTRKAMSEISGIGPSRIEQYADQFLALLLKSDTQ